jgi:hypothetical protein
LMHPSLSMSAPSRLDTNPIISGLDSMTKLTTSTGNAPSPIALDLFQSDRDHPSTMMSTENQLVLKEYENSFDQVRLIRRQSHSL